MSSFEIELSRTHITHDGQPYPVWIASVTAPAYQDVYGRTPGEAIHALEREFDDMFGHDPRGNWDDDTTLSEVLDIDDAV